MESNGEETYFDTELVHMFENLSIDSSTEDSRTSTDAEVSKSSVSQDEDTGSDCSFTRLSHTAQSFRALGKIVNFMRKRYQSGSDRAMQPLTFEEILIETKQTNLNDDIKAWLSREALCTNKRIKVSENGPYYQFKPAYQLKNIDDLIELLKEHERKGLGGILMDDIRDSLPNYRQILRDCDGRVIVFKRPLDKKSIVYYVGHGIPTTTDVEQQAMWRSLGLEDIEEVYEPSEDNEIER